MSNRFIPALLVAIPALCLAAGARSDRPALGETDHNVPPRPHVDNFSGKAVLFMDTDRRRLVLGLDTFDANERTDGRVNHLFLFGVGETIESPILMKGRALVHYWHEGLRIDFPNERRSFDLIRTDTAPPAALGAAPFPVSRFARGTGVIHYSGPVVQAFSLDEMGPGAEDSPIYEECLEPPCDGDIGGSCEPQSCTVACSGGSSCSASCSAGRRAHCSSESCPNPICSCSPC